MTVSMRKMSPGDGYKYLLRTVAAGDGDRSLSTPLTRYYAEARHTARTLARLGPWSAGAGRTPTGRSGPRVATGAADRAGAGPDFRRPARSCLSRISGCGGQDRRAHCRDPRRGLRTGPRRRDRPDRGGGGGRQQPPTGRRLRLHLQRAKVRLGPVGRGRCRPSGDDRRGTPRCRRRGHRLPRTRGRRHPLGHRQPQRRRRPGRRFWRHRGRVRPLRLPRRRPAAAHARRHLQQRSRPCSTAAGAVWTADLSTRPSPQSPPTTTPCSPTA